MSEDSWLIASALNPAGRGSRSPLLDERYRLVEELGRGGMGAVYRAIDLQRNTEVAVKRLLCEDPQPRQRFLREGELAAGLSHPGLVRVLRVGEHAGSPYIVYELVPGANQLDSVLPHASLQRRLELIRDAAVALGHAHEHGVVHRDVKPANVLVDLAGQVRVTDFGLATASGSGRITQSGALLGTPRYMAPEQIRGERAAIGPATDVWALGLLTYEALTGSYPWDCSTFPELMIAILEEKLVPPAKQVRGLPQGASEVCMRALQRDPARRYPDGQALARALDQVLTPASTQAGSRLPMAVTSAALVLALLIGARWVFDTEPPPRREVAHLPDPAQLLERARQLSRARAPFGEVWTMLAAAERNPHSNARDVRYEQLRLCLRRRNLIRALELARSLIAERDEPEVRYLEAVALEQQGELQASRENLVYLTRVDPAGEYGLAAAIRLDREDWQDVDRVSRAEETAREAVERFPGSFALRHELAGVLLIRHFGRYRHPAPGYGEEALALATELTRAQPDDHRLQSLLGMAFSMLQRPSESYEAYLAAVGLSEPNVPSDTLFWLALSGRAAGRLSIEEGIQRLDEALQLEPAHPRYLLLRGLWHHQQGNVDQAALDWRQGYESDPQKFQRWLRNHSIQPELVRELIGSGIEPDH